MLIEEKLIAGQPMLPEVIDTVMSYDGCPLIGTFQVDGHHILFWSADAPDSPTMRYVYVELTDEEASALATHFRANASDQPAYEEHPLLMNRRVVVGLSDENWLLSKTAVIEHPTPKVFEEIDALFPALV